MNGARMRSYSLSGTLPEKISRSVLAAERAASQRTRTRLAGGATGSARITAGGRDTRAPAPKPSFRLDPEPAARYIPPGPKSIQCPNAPLTSPPRGLPTP